MRTVRKEEKRETAEEKARLYRVAHMPILEQCYNLMDFEAVARHVMKKATWVYCSSGADDEIVSCLRIRVVVLVRSSDQ
jgi:L-lactate dehydrogenase (cytochrome)